MIVARQTSILTLSLSLCAVLASSLMSAPALAQTTIFPIGDSITRGTENYSFTGSEYPESAYRIAGSEPNSIRSYREHLHDMLTGPGCNADIDWTGTQVLNGRTPRVHEGHSGWRIDNFLNNSWQDKTVSGGATRNFEGWIIDRNADVYLVHLGSNDLGQGQSVFSTQNDIVALIDKIYNADPDATVLIVDVIPMAGWNALHPYSRPNENVDMNSRIASLIATIANKVSTDAASGRDIHMVEVNGGFYNNESNPVSCPTPLTSGNTYIGTGGDANNMSLKRCFRQPGTTNSAIPDGIHPSAPGDRFIAEQFFAKMQSELGICGGGNGDPDTEAPTNVVNVPSGNGQTFMGNPVFSGTSADTGGSGFDRVRVVVRDNNAGSGTNDPKWLNFATGEFVARGATLPDRNATLSNTTVSSTDWSVSIPLTAPGDYQLFVQGYDNAGNNAFDEGHGWTQRQFFVAGNGSTPSVTSPSAGDQLAGSSVTFNWNANGTAVANWWVYVGSSIGTRNYENSGGLGNAASSYTVNGLPTDGSDVWLRLWYLPQAGGGWQSVDVQYEAVSSGSSSPTFTSPTPGSQFTGSSQSVFWTDGGSGAQQFWVYAGSSAGARDYHDSGQLGSALSTTVSGLPTSGQNVWMRLWYRSGSNANWSFVDTRFDASNSSEPTITSPAPGSDLSGESQLFSWDPRSSGANAFWIYAGSSAGAKDFHDSGSLGNSASETVSGLPNDGGGAPVFIRLWYRVGSTWLFVDKQYNAAAF